MFVGLIAYCIHGSNTCDQASVSKTTLYCLYQNPKIPRRPACLALNSGAWTKNLTYASMHLLGTLIQILRLGKKEMWKLDVFVSPRYFNLCLVNSVCRSERDSPRDQLIVTLFLLIVFGLLVGAGIKSRMEKAGMRFDTSAAWDAARVGRRWWEVSQEYPCLTPFYLASFS